MAEGQWAIVELFGHKVVSGLVTKDDSMGFPMMRIDVPATKDYPSFTQFYGDKAVYGVTCVSEDVARMTAEQVRSNPVAVYVPDLVTRETYETKVTALQQTIRLLQHGLPQPDKGADDATPH